MEIYQNALISWQKHVSNIPLDQILKSWLPSPSQPIQTQSARMPWLRMSRACHTLAFTMARAHNRGALKLQRFSLLGLNNTLALHVLWVIGCQKKQRISKYSMAESRNSAQESCIAKGKSWKTLEDNALRHLWAEITWCAHHGRYQLHCMCQRPTYAKVTNGHRLLMTHSICMNLLVISHFIIDS